MINTNGVKSFKSDKQNSQALAQAHKKDFQSQSQEKKKIRLSSKCVVAQQQNLYGKSNQQQIPVKIKEFNKAVSKCRSISGVRKSVPNHQSYQRQPEKKELKMQKSIEKINDAVPNKIKQLIKAHSRDLVSTHFQNKQDHQKSPSISSRRSKSNKMQSSSKISPKKNIQDQIAASKLSITEYFTDEKKQEKSSKGLKTSLDNLGIHTNSIQQEGEIKKQQKGWHDLDSKKKRSSRKCQIIRKQGIHHDRPTVPKIPLKEQVPAQENKAELNRLLQITSKCVQYYNKFLQQKEGQIYVINDAFDKIEANLDFAFDELVNTIRQKQKNIKKYLNERYQNFVKIKESQDQKLRQTLQEIKQVHLAKILGQQWRGFCIEQNKKEQKYQLTEKVDNLAVFLSKESSSPHERPQSPKIPAQTIQYAFEDISISQTESGIKSTKKDIQKEITQYASTLKLFYQKMQEIQQFDFKESVEQSINFINNLIAQQIKMIIDQKSVGDINLEQERIEEFEEETLIKLDKVQGKRNDQKSSNISFSFNCEKIISRMSSKASLFPDSTHDLLKEIQSFQDRRKNNIKRYSMLLR